MTFPLPTALAICVACVLNVLLMVTTVAAVALLIARSVLRHDAPARYRLCLFALNSILLAPLLLGVLSYMRSELVVFTLSLLKLQVQQMPRTLSTITLATSDKSATNFSQLAHNPIFWIMGALLTLWAMGIARGVARFVYICRSVVEVRRMGQPLTAPILESVLLQVQQTLGSPLPPILTSESVVSPVAVGWVRPAVILPDGMVETLSPVQLRHVLLHECAHVTFRHAWGGIVQRLAQALCWPHPLVIVLCRELGQAREEMCDDVASQEDGAACYARTLLAIAQGISIAPQYASELALVGPETSLERRICGLLDPRRNRTTGVKGWKAWLVTFAMVFAMAVATAVHVVADDAKMPKKIVSAAHGNADAVPISISLQITYDETDAPTSSVTVDNSGKFVSSATEVVIGNSGKTGITVSTAHITFLGKIP